MQPVYVCSRVFGEWGAFPGQRGRGLAAGIPDEVRKGREGWTLRGSARWSGAAACR